MTSRIGDVVVDCADPPLLARFWCEALPEPKAVKNRLHFDVCPTDRDPDEELERLLALGARRSSIQAGGTWTVLEDPEGNEYRDAARLWRLPGHPDWARLR